MEAFLVICVIIFFSIISALRKSNAQRAEAERQRRQQESRLREFSGRPDPFSYTPVPPASAIKLWPDPKPPAPPESSFSHYHDTPNMEGYCEEGMAGSEGASGMEGSVPSEKVIFDSGEGYGYFFGKSGSINFDTMEGVGTEGFSPIAKDTAAKTAPAAPETATQAQPPIGRERIKNRILGINVVDGVIFSEILNRPKRNMYGQRVR